MPDPFKTENLRIILDTPLGPDKFFVRNVWGDEGLSRLFRFELDLLSNDPAVDLDAMLGASVTLQIMLATQKRTFLNGIVSRLRHSGGTETMHAYRAEVVPWPWLLTRELDSRIFQFMTAPDIIHKVIKDSGVKAEVEDKLQGSYASREYCVQYQESDFNFISRLMEEEGIAYFFKHDDGKHTLVLADSKDAHPSCPLESRFEVLQSASERTDQDYVSHFEVERVICPGVYCATDYNFQTPSTELLVKQKGKDRPEIYEFPGGFYERDVGDCLARVRLEELEWQRHTASGNGDCRAFRSGHKFELSKHSCPDYDKEYLLLQVNHSASQAGELGSESDGGGAAHYLVQFTALPSDIPYRPRRVTPQPRIYGTQTAVVTGKSGEEIWTDKYGRIKVQFFWDREGKRDENSSCWIRCAYGVSGKTWGQIFIPRIGQEVLVAFLEGDPDRPIIIGGVYNEEQMPPYELPADQTKSTIKSRSSKGGGPPNFNEFRFEDKKGGEEIYLHAEKDYNQVTENDRSEDVGHDRSLHVGHDKHEKIDNNKTIEVLVDHKETIGANKSVTVAVNHAESIGADMTINVASTLTETVGINYAETVGAAMELTIGGAFAETVGGAKAQTIGGAKEETVGGTKSETVGGDKSTSIGGKETIDVSGAQSVTVGGDYGVGVAGKGSITVDGELQISSGAKGTIETKEKLAVSSEDEILLSCGSASIKLTKDGSIEIKGDKITIKSSGDVKVKGSSVAIN